MEINVKNLYKSYGTAEVLKDMNLILKDIHTLVIIGPSGGGKSTFLRLLAGLEVPDSGDITVNGKVIPKIEEKLHDYRKGIGVVFQAYNLFPHLSALENILLPLEKVHKIPHGEAKERSEKLLERYQLKEHMDKKPHQLSGGQQQRTAIVRALALEAEFLLLDEPTSALDPALTMEILDAIMELKKDRKDMVLVTHEMGFAKTSADYVIFIANGIVMEAGTPQEIFNSPKTSELREFLGKSIHF